MSSDRIFLRIGAICLIVGSLAIFAFRLAHGDPPAANPEAHLRFITDHPAYAGVHLGTILGVVLWVGGVIVLASTLTHPLGTLLGRWGVASVLVGAAIFSVDFTIDGVAGQDLATAWAAAPPERHPHRRHPAARPLADRDRHPVGTASPARRARRAAGGLPGVARWDRDGGGGRDGARCDGAAA
jgi:hypothetical protein